MSRLEDALFPDDDRRNAYRDGFVRLRLQGNADIDLMAGCEEAVRRAMRERNVFYDGTDVFGDPVTVLVSAIIGYGVCTKEGLTAYINYIQFRTERIESADKPWD